MAPSRKLLLFSMLVSVATATDYRACTSACSFSVVPFVGQVEPYRACHVANSSVMYTTLQRQLTGISTLCGAALQAVAERISNEVCEIGLVSVPLCAQSARTFLSAHCGSDAARTLLSQPPLLVLAAGSAATSTESCAVVDFSPNASWISWAGLTMALCSSLLFLLGRHLERQGRWRAGATGQHVFTDASWVSGWCLLAAATAGALLSLGMASLALLTALVAPAVLAAVWAELPTPASRAALGATSITCSVAIVLLSSSALPRLTAGAVTWLFMAPALWLGLATLCMACGAVHGASPPPSAQGGAKGGTLPVLPCIAESSSCRSWRQRGESRHVGCLALALVASLLGAVAVSACKAAVSMLLGASVNGFAGPSPAAESIFWIAVLLAAGAGTASAVAGARLFNLYSPPQALLAAAAGFVLSQLILHTALWQRDTEAADALGVLFLCAQAVVLAWGSTLVGHTAGGLSTGVGGEPVGQGVPHRVALPDSSALPSLSALDFASGQGCSLDTSMTSTGAEVPTPARKLLKWFNTAAGGGAGRRVGGVSYSRVGAADVPGEPGSASGSGSTSPQPGSGGDMLDSDQDDHGDEHSPLRGGEGAGSLPASSSRGALAELDVFDSDEDIDWSKV